MNVPYAVWPIGISILYFYFFSYFLVKSGFLSGLHFRKIWNYILLVVFLPLIVTGLFLALQINYKWDIPSIEKILNWHVNTGIAFSITAIIHFLRHFQYYLSFREKKSKPDTSNEAFTAGKSTINLFMLGFVSLTSQIIIIRAGLNIFEGNELTLGMILGIWMLYTALGALSGRRKLNAKIRKQISKNGLFYLSLLTLLTYILIIIIKHLFYAPGVSAGLGGTLLIFSVVLLPFCFFSGVFFLLISKEVKLKRQNGFTYSYFLESSGSLLAGLFTSFISVYFLDLFQTAVLLSIITLLTKLLGKYYRSIKIYWFLLLSMFVLLFFLPVEDQLVRLIYPGQKIILNNHDPYGNIVVTKTNGQLNIFSNNKLLYSYDDVVVAEEIAHFPMSQINDPGNVMQISGGHTGSLAEILLHDPESIDFVETDPGMVEIIKRFTTHLDNDKINQVSSDDAVQFLRKTEKKYDAIIVATPPPSNLALSRYYSQGFIRSVKEKMTDEGILSISLPTAGDYSTENAIKLNSALYNTLKEVFRNVRILPGSENYFLASDSPVSIDIPGLMQEKGIETDYVNEFYLMKDELEMRSDLLESELIPDQEIITMEKPTAFFYSVSYWAGKYSVNLKIVIFITVLILLFFILPQTGNVMNLIMFFAGFTSAGFEIILLFKLQSELGNLYQYSALIIALFMTGLAIGSFPFKKNQQRHYINLLIFTFLLALSGIIITLDVDYLMGKPGLYTINISILTLLISAFTGSIFRYSSGLKSKIKSDSEQTLYSSDLMGGAIGSFISALILIPFAGISGAAFILSGLMLVSLVVLAAKSSG